MSDFVVTPDLISRVLSTVDKGLSSGLGTPTPGNMCVEAAVCYAMGLPHGDEPTCVSPAIRKLKIALNDSSWSSKKARASGMRRLSVLQLGTKNFNDTVFADRVTVFVINEILPLILKLGGVNTLLIENCINAKTLKQAHAAARAAYAAADAAASRASRAAHAAARAAYAAVHAAARAKATAFSNAASAARAAAYAAAYDAAYDAAVDAVARAKATAFSNAASAARAAAYAAAYDAAYAAVHAAARAKATAFSNAARAAAYAAAYDAAYDAAVDAVDAVDAIDAVDAVDASAAAAYAVDAVRAAAYAAYAYVAADEVLNTFAKGVEDILIDMNVPAVEFLYLLEK